MDEYGFSDYASPGDIVGHTLGGYEFDDLIADSAVTWLRRKGRPLNDAGKPWCLTLSLVNPHDIMYLNTDLPEQPVQDKGGLLFRAAPAPHHRFYDAHWDTPVADSLTQPFDEAGRPPAHGEYQKGWDSLLGHIPAETSRWERFNDFYVNSIRSVDMKLARLLDELDALGISERTIIVFTADHGEMSGAHGLRNKGPFAYAERTSMFPAISSIRTSGADAPSSHSRHMSTLPRRFWNSPGWSKAGSAMSPAASFPAKAWPPSWARRASPASMRCARASCSPTAD
jgi:arylsulfatase